MADEASVPARSTRPLYYPSGDAPDFIRYSVPFGRSHVNHCPRFDVIGYHDTWHVGPLCQSFMTAQIRWSELKLWILYFRIILTRKAKWPCLLSLESRLACSWWYQSDCMDVPADLLVRRVRNEFCLKPRKSRVELLLMANELLG